MLSLSVKLPDGSKSLVKGDSVSDLWDAVWQTCDIPYTKSSINEGSANYCSTYTTETNYTSLGNTTISSGTIPGEYLFSTPSIWYPPWDYSYTVFQKLPYELCSNPSSPPVDIYRDKNKSLHYLWAVAGYGLDNISVEFEDGYLLLTLEKEESKKIQKDRVYLTRGIKHGKIENKYFIGDKYDTKNISAKLKEGILEVVIPMKEEEKPVKISVSKE